MSLAAPAFAFAAAALTCVAMGELAAARSHGRRTPRGSGAGRGGGVVRLFAAAGRLVRLSSRAPAPRDLSARIAAAGLPDGLGERELMAAKIAAAGAAGVWGALVGAVAPGRLGIATALAAPVAGFLAPDLWLARRSAHRARGARRELPALLDLLRVTIEAGLPLAAALGAVGERSTGIVAREWRAVGREVELGVPLAAAMSGMAIRLPLPEIEALAGTLSRAARHGVPLAGALAAQARDVRLAERRRVQEEAARAGPKIQLVVALLLVPSVLLMVAAALAGALLGGDGVAGLR